MLSTLSAQVLYTSAPLSLLVLLNLANRRRLEQENEERTTIALADLDQRLSQNIELLHQQVLALPTVETVGSLRKSLLQKNRELLEKLSEDITDIQQEMQQRLIPLEQQNMGSVRREVRQIREQCVYLGETVTQLSTQLQRLTASGKVEGVEKLIAQLEAEVTQLQTKLHELGNHVKPSLTSLQDQLNHVSRQLQKLPPPIDPSSLKQEVGELVRVVADLVPKRDVAALVSEVKQLHQQQETLKESIATIEATAQNLKQHSDSATEPLKTGLFAEVQGLMTAQTQLRTQLETVQRSTQTLSQQQQQLRTQVSQLPQTLDVIALQRQLQELTESVTALERSAPQTDVKDLLHHEFRDLNQQLQALPSAVQYEFIFDLKPTQGKTEAIAGSRAVLEEALAQTQNRLILILPWSTQYGLDTALMQQFEAFLQRHKQLDLGWCYQVNFHEERFLSTMRRGWSTASSDGVKDTLDQLLRLKRLYPDRFRFKILGTAENFLVSDQTFAVMGIHNTLTTNTALTEMQLKLRTTDPKVVQRLIDRFDNPVLDAQDLAAHWNRAVTRYDLGDKAGAIADYTHVLMLQPNDPTTYNHRGVVRYDLGDRQGALADFNQSIQLNPHQTTAFCNRGFLQAEAGNHLGAVTDYSAAIQNQPSPIAYFYRGMACQKLADYQSAVQDYHEALRLAPQSAVARYYRGVTYQKLGKHQDAIADLELAVEYFQRQGSSSNVQKALNMLERSWQALNAIDFDAAGAAHPQRLALPAVSRETQATGVSAAEWEAVAHLFQEHQDIRTTVGNGHAATNLPHEIDPEFAAVFDRF